MNIVSCDLLGPAAANPGLGNILFQIATIESLALDNNLQAVFPCLLKPEFSDYHTNILRKCNTNSHDLNKIYTHPWEYCKLPVLPNQIYFGYFQSEQYFLHNRKFILDLFDIPTHIDSPIVSIHIRRGDFVTNQENHCLLPLDYYYLALEHLQKQRPVTKAMVFSDDIEWCKHNLDLGISTDYSEGLYDWQDLYLMSSYSLHIIANSTFSWWGAWMNDDKNKTVIAPKSWFGLQRKLTDKNIIPNDWIRL